MISNNKFKISIILTSYNQEDYLKEAIESILNQTYNDFQLIIIDDCSTDNSTQVIKQFENNPKVLFIKNKINLGLVMTVNKGINLSNSEYIALFTSDDISMPTRIEKQLNYMEKNLEVAVCFSHATTIDQKGKSTRKVQYYQNNFNRAKNKNNRFKWLRFFFDHHNCLAYPSAFIRKSCLDKVGLFDPRYQMSLDIDMWIRICTYYKIYILEESLIKFRVGKQSLSSDISNRNIMLHEFGNIFSQYLYFTDEIFKKVFPEKGLKQKTLSQTEKALFLIELDFKNHNPIIFLSSKIFYDAFKNATEKEANQIKSFFNQRGSFLKTYRIDKKGIYYSFILFTRDIKSYFNNF